MCGGSTGIKTCFQLNRPCAKTDDAARTHMDSLHEMLGFDVEDKGEFTSSRDFIWCGLCPIRYAHLVILWDIKIMRLSQSSALSNLTK